MKKTIAIIGGGPAALSFASFIDTDKYDCTVYEKNNAISRKFLVAGKGGFNLTHNENLELLKLRYLPLGFMDEALAGFSNVDLRTWLSSLKIETFAGSSNRVYPVEGIKPIEVLNAIHNNLIARNIKIQTKKEWLGCKNSSLDFKDECIDADYTVFALGGKSWSKTGSNGAWIDTFENAGIDVELFEASNCNMSIDWPLEIKNNFAGEPIKNIACFVDGKQQKGELVITENGIEGNAIYALSPEIRKLLKSEGIAKVNVDFKPNVTNEVLIEKLNRVKGNMTKKLKDGAKLSKVQIHLLKAYSTKEQFTSIEKLCDLIKGFELEIKGLSNIDKAISTVGGISIRSISKNYEIRAKKGHFCIGEMVDWDAPTGGYLLQGCFSMGHHLASHLNSLENV